MQRIKCSKNQKVWKKKSHNVEKGNSNGTSSTKEKWEITIDALLIIGKYFETSIDYVNVMKTPKGY